MPHGRLRRLTSRAAHTPPQIESFLPGVPAAKLMNVGDEIVEVDGVVDLLNCLPGSGPVSQAPPSQSAAHAR